MPPILVKFLLSASLLMAVAIGAFFYGRGTGIDIAQSEISQYEKTASDLNAALATAGAKTDVQVVTKYVTVKAENDKIVYVNRDIVRDGVVPEQFTLSMGFIYTYNQTVLGLEADPALAADPTPSGVKDIEALDYMMKNVGTGKNSENLALRLQEWVAQKKADVEKINKEQE